MDNEKLLSLIQFNILIITKKVDTLAKGAFFRFYSVIIHIRGTVDAMGFPGRTEAFFTNSTK